MKEIGDSNEVCEVCGEHNQAMLLRCRNCEPENNNPEIDKPNQFISIRELSWNGTTFKTGKVWDLEPPSFVKGEVFNLCCGHGCFERLIIGEDVILYIENKSTSIEFENVCKNLPDAIVGSEAVSKFAKMIYDSVINCDHVFRNNENSVKCILCGKVFDLKC